MRRGPFYGLQADAGAAFVESHGWEVPAAYGSPEAELAALKEKVGLVDLTGWGVLGLRGSNRQDFVHRMSTNDVQSLRTGQGAPTVFTTPVGRIVDLAFMSVGEDEVSLLVGRGADEAVAAWLRGHIFYNDDVLVENLTEGWGLMGCRGPAASTLMGEIVGADAMDLAPFRALKHRIEGVDVIVTRSVPLGNDYLVLAQRDQAPSVWVLLAAAVASAGGTLVGELALETARIGAGWPLYGPELGEDYIPLEAGLRSAISFNKGCYVGQEIIARMDTYQRIAKRLVVLGCGETAEPDSPGLDPGDEVWAGDKAVGRITSVAPLVDGGVVKALAYVKTEVAESGRELTVDHAGAGVRARVLTVVGES
jgi:folate-binding protein YgfZ